jgi:hypothetical protein
MEQLATLPGLDLSAVSIGRIVEITAEGRVLVDFPENRARRPIEARFVSLGAFPIDVASLAGASVLMVFEDANPFRPIILGPLFDRISSFPKTPSQSPNNAMVEAQEEILLRCGESSLSMKKDGKIVLKGRTIVSRASRTNKMRGALVAIN